MFTKALSVTSQLERILMVLSVSAARLDFVCVKLSAKLVGGQRQGLLFLEAMWPNGLCREQQQHRSQGCCTTPRRQHPVRRGLLCNEFFFYAAVHKLCLWLGMSAADVDAVDYQQGVGGGKDAADHSGWVRQGRRQREGCCPRRRRRRRRRERWGGGGGGGGDKGLGLRLRLCWSAAPRAWQLILQSKPSIAFWNSLMEWLPDDLHCLAAWGALTWTQTWTLLPDQQVVKVFKFICSKNPWIN